jgi:hypothetical protein
MFCGKDCIALHGQICCFLVHDKGFVRGSNKPSLFSNMPGKAAQKMTFSRSRLRMSELQMVWKKGERSSEVLHH